MRDAPSLNVIGFQRRETESLSDIEVLLEGAVFHVARREHWPAIEASGALLPNPDRSLPTTFGSSANSFFRNRGCICLFDYRAPPDDTIREYRRRCYPFQPAAPGNAGVAILVLNQSVHGELLPWTLWKEAGALDQMVVPHVEAGYPRPIPLRLVDRMILLRVEEDPESFAAVVRASW